MPNEGKLYDFYLWLRDDVGYHGVLLGILLSITFQPWLNAIVVQSAHATGVPGYQAPDLHLEYSAIGGNYEDGVSVDEFDGLQWSSEYRIFRVTIENRGTKPIHNLKVDVPLPGCVEYTKESGAFVGGDYRLRNTVDARIRTSNGSLESTPVEKRVCAKRFVTERLSPTEKIGAEFVVTNDFDRCDVLLGLVGKRGNGITYQYFWEKRAVQFQERATIEAGWMDRPYQDPIDGPRPVTTGIRGNILGRTYPVHVVGQEGEDVHDALDKCPPN